jgi:hypothetical protein
VAGFAIGLGSILETLQPFVALTGRPALSLDSFRAFGPAYLWLALASVALVLAADGLLLAGLAGEWLGKPWARRVLYTYVGTLAASWVFDLSARWAMQRYFSNQFPYSGSLAWGIFVGGVASLFTVWTYPALLITCLRWPEMRRASPPGHGFTPVMRSIG